MIIMINKRIVGRPHQPLSYAQSVCENLRSALCKVKPVFKTNNTVLLFYCFSVFLSYCLTVSQCVRLCSRSAFLHSQPSFEAGHCGHCQWSVNRSSLRFTSIMSYICVIVLYTHCRHYCRILTSSQRRQALSHCQRVCGRTKVHSSCEEQVSRWLSDFVCVLPPISELHCHTVDSVR